MSSCVPLVFLLCVSGTWAQPAGGRGSAEIAVPIQSDGRGIIEPPDFWDELKMLRDMVHSLDAVVSEQRETLRVAVTELASYKKQLEDLNKLVADKPKVAFSATMTASVGPFKSYTTLAYTKVLTNVGQGYNSTTGVFTAPVRGVYHFTFTACAIMQDGSPMGLHLYKNGQKVIIVAENDNDQQFEYESNATVLELEKGDEVYMRLPTGFTIYDDSFNRNTFSGFLLYTM